MTNKNLWCLIYKSIPLVFDNSLSYYEQICKFVEYLNNIKNDINLLQTEIDNLNVDKIIQTINNEIEQIINEFEQNINEIKEMIYDYELKTENELDNFKNYINKDISDFKIAINELVKKDPTLCIDPINGKIEDTCTIFQDIYNAMQIDALSCQEFDNAQKITCDYFDDSNITALEYDLKSKTILL